MAKKRTAYDNDLPPGVEANAPEPTPNAPADKPKPIEKRVVETRQVTVSQLVVRLPSFEGDNGYSKRRIDVHFNTAKQADFWKRVTAGLQDEQARLDDGKFVRSPSDAVKWIAENANVD